MSKISEALAAWRQAVRELEITKPGGTAWDRARLDEEGRRAAYQTAAADARRQQHYASARAVEGTARAPRDLGHLEARIDPPDQHMRAVEDAYDIDAISGSAERS
jgi:hypothetical protein